jgi:cysteinyl-tRNA synthetase
MALRLYNTLTRKLEKLVPQKDNQIRMYTCGPTVYHFVHIGNFRTFVFQDILRRYIQYRGFSLLHVMNVTDVEDKIIANAQKEGLSIQEYTRRYEEEFLKDMDTLRIQRPEIMPRATEHISEMINLVSRLDEKGLTYQSEGSTYYRISGFGGYGKLSGLESAEEESGGRVDSDEYTKENPRDFVLWKGFKPGEESWDSPFGKGRPGWHLECSAMSMKYLGETFDIHCGGIDLVFPHHENEIAQSEGATGKPFVRYWVHGAHLIVENQKMSKSLGNFYTLRDLLDKGFNALALRYLLASVHYRKQLNFTFDGISQAQSSIQRVNDFLVRIRELKEDAVEKYDAVERVNRARIDFESAMDSDLNTSAALAAIFELIRDLNPQLDEKSVGNHGKDAVLQFFHSVNQVFDVFQVEEETITDGDILKLIEERNQARKRKNFQKADEIRDQLMDRGIVLEDTREGTRWKRVL